MKLEKLAATAEIISSVAIVVTLVYLAIQTQQTNRVLLTSSRQATMQADVSVTTALLDHPDVLEAMGIPPDQPKFSIAFASMLRIREFAWLQYQEGILDESAFSSYMSPFINGVSREAGATWWAGIQQTTPVDPAFTEYVNQRIADLR